MNGMYHFKWSNPDVSYRLHCICGTILSIDQICTPNIYMEQITPNICRGLRSINPYVEANPQWFMIEIFDGFGAHMASHLALRERLAYRILSIKEEGDTSHVNQAYDKFVAKKDKQSRNYSVAVQRECKYYNKGVIDQWGLVHSGLHAVREVTKNTWTNEPFLFKPVTTCVIGSNTLQYQNSLI